MPGSNTESLVYKHYLDNQRSKLISDIIRASAGAAVVGAGVGGTQQLLKRFMRKPVSDTPIDPALNDVALPVPVKKKKPEVALDKYASSVGKGLSNVADYAGKAIGSAWSNFSDAFSPKADINYDSMRDNAENFPWYYGGLVGGIGAGGVGGYALAHQIGKKMNEQDDQEEVEEAKREYEQALLGNYQNNMQSKRANNKEWDISTPFNYVREKLLPNWIPGAYMAYAMPAAAMGGAYGYYKNKEKNKRAIEAALKRRAAIRGMESPTPLHFVPVPTEEDQ